ncbi:MAG: penicillin acylase family protein, partial [Pseudonocardiaceae bacterium]
GTGARLDGGAAPPVPGGRLDTPFGTVELRAITGMSNAALVSGERTRDGHPIAVFGPQTGYFTPQLLTEISLSGPGIRARGVAFAGINFLVQIGRGEGYAFSATSSGSDTVDTVVERLCDPSGAPATVDATHYLRDGRCVPMQRFEHTETALPTATAPGGPQRLRFLVLRTHHGIVQQRTTVGTAPVAVVTQRSTYGREVDSVVGFARFNDPGFLTGPAAFTRAAAEIDYTFNWFYADAADISFVSSGRLPLRSAGVDPDLPRWGDAASGSRRIRCSPRPSRCCAAGRATARTATATAPTPTRPRSRCSTSGGPAVPPATYYAARWAAWSMSCRSRSMTIPTGGSAACGARSRGTAMWWRT